MRVVLDTNILARAFTSLNSPAREVLIIAALPPHRAELALICRIAARRALGSRDLFEVWRNPITLPEKP